MEHNELKPCPFCGGEAQIRQNDVCGGFGMYITKYFVMCAKCGARGASADDYYFEHPLAKAVTAWNRRANNEQSKDM